jgi:hypothetical protein
LAVSRDDAVASVTAGRGLWRGGSSRGIPSPEDRES